MNFVFFGSPEFAKIVLEKLIKNKLVPSILICNPDKPVGRKKVMTYPSTKALVLENKCETRVFQPTTKKELSELFLNGQIKAEFGIVAAYSKIIPKDVLDSFPRGVIGIHPSLLPKLRGASPIQSAILQGFEETGVTLYLMDQEMDHGKIINQTSNIEIKNLKYEELEKKLAEVAGDLIVETLPKFINGKINPVEQDHSMATLTKKFETQDGFVDLEKDDPVLINRKIRALNPDPGVFALINGKRVKLLEIEEKDEQFVITKILPEGKKIQSAKIILRPR